MPVGAVCAAAELAQALNRIAATESRIKSCARIEGRLIKYELHCMIVTLGAVSKPSYHGVIQYPLQFRAFASPDLDVLTSSATANVN